ncbi:inactive peptidyl-prolyl cis-trans isomerase shutdown-like [Sitodiplosis mosellana]|uniref:inactive peptidyl-prolyl cis-trans isomerase shutdown-like n=1 Tax=Sitodiplosis mosellana TaxID=263140 RepID=UPI0024449A31|nr:inactive peptidyl-prolyl cis-trans isomerase shutdown-like [Sitodiplosis mosellana]
MDMNDAIKLENPIKIDSSLLEKPIMFTLDRNQLVNNVDDNLIEDDDMNEEAKPKATPWLESFDELKTTMVKIPEYNIYKRTIFEGNGDAMGRRKCRIQWSYSMFMEREENSYDSSCGVKTNLYDELFPGIWYALETMCKGEESHFIISYTLMFGEFGHDAGNVKIKPKADILLVAKLVNFREIGSENACDELSGDELRKFGLVKEKVMEMQKKVSDLCRKREFERAIRVNLQILQRLQFCDIENGDELKEKNQIFADVYEKLIDYYIKIENYKEAFENVTRLRQISDVDRNVNVLVNEAIARSKVDDDYNRSIVLLRRAQQLDPHNESVNSTLNDIQKARDKYKNEMKGFLQRAFQLKPQPQVNKAQGKGDHGSVNGIMDSFAKLDIGTSAPLVGYTAQELKMVEEAVENDASYELQMNSGSDGQRKYFIKKLA